MTKKQGYSTVVCFVLTCIVAIIMFMNGLIVHAEELDDPDIPETSISDIYDYDFAEFPFWTIQGYENSIIYDSNVQTFNNYVSPATESLINSLDVSEYSDYPYFCVLQIYTSPNVFVFIFYRDGSLIISGNSKSGLFGSSDFVYVVANNSGGFLSLDSSQTEEGSGDYIFTSRNNNRLVCSNTDIYGTVGVWNDVNTLPESTYKNFNYVIYDENGNLKYNNPITGGGSTDNTYPDGSGGTTLNNMYMETADWKFDIPVYWRDSSKTSYIPNGLGSNWGKGTVSFYGLLNDYQIDNASDFELQFDFYIKFNAKYSVDGVQDGDEPVFRSFAHSYAWRDVRVPLSDFLNSNNLYTWSVQDIFENALDLNYYNITQCQDYLDRHAYYKDWDWTLSCSAHLVSGNYTSGNIQETYNFITMISKENSNTITENHNPYYPEDENGDPVIDTGDNDSQVITDSNGNIILTNNDNDNITINGNGDVAKDLYHEIIPTSGEGGLSESIQESFNTNGWLTVMRTVFSFVPEEVFDTIAIYVISALGICVAGFALRIILDLL